MKRKAYRAEAIFVFDANILLNLYRMKRATSSAIMDVLGKLTERLFLPHQVGVEFHRHREEEIAKQVNTFEHVRKFLIGIPEKFTNDFTRHPCIPIDDIATALTECITEQVAKVNQSQSDNLLNYITHDDPILPRLDSLFADFCEGPYTGTEDTP